ncbi:MAG: hypothetical protein KKC51_12465 [Verrucomicrobia bacterium]|nr:hypothetical protein [Verrucomicrobiota bacterium]
MKGEHHLAISVVAAAAIYATTRSVPMIATFLAAGVLLDLDHWMDYWAEYGPRFDIRHFLNAIATKAFRRAFVLLHAWEGVILSAFLTWWTGWTPWLAGLTLGWGIHLLLDQGFNSPSPWAYSLLWRLWGRFDYKRAFPKPYEPEDPGT